MQSGDLTERITFQVAQRVSDGGGGYSETMTDLPSNANDFAHIAPVSGRERLENAQAKISGLYRVTLRRRDDLLSSYEIVWGDVRLNIVDLPFVSAREPFIQILAEVV